MFNRFIMLGAAKELDRSISIHGSNGDVPIARVLPDSRLPHAPPRRRIARRLPAIHALYSLLAILMPLDWLPLWLSLRAAAIATAGAALIGIPAAYWLANRESKGRDIVGTAVTLPLVRGLRAQ